MERLVVVLVLVVKVMVVVVLSMVVTEADALSHLVLEELVEVEEDLGDLGHLGRLHADPRGDLLRAGLGTNKSLEIFLAD